MGTFLNLWKSWINTLKGLSICQEKPMKRQPHLDLYWQSFFFFLRYKHKRNIHSSKEEHKLSLKENKPGFLECLIWNTEWRKMMKQCLYRYNKILQSEIFIYNWKYKRTENIPPSRVFKNLLELYSKQLIYKAKF